MLNRMRDVYALNSSSYVKEKTSKTSQKTLRKLRAVKQTPCEPYSVTSRGANAGALSTVQGLESRLHKIG